MVRVKGRAGRLVILQVRPKQAVGCGEYAQDGQCIEIDQGPVQSIMLRFIFHPPDTKEGPGKEEDVGAYEVNGKEGEEKDEAPKEETVTTPPVPKETQLIEVPFTDVEVPMPTTEIMTAAATTAFISVAATLSATSLFKWLVTVMKPVFKQTWNKLTKQKNQEVS